MKKLIDKALSLLNRKSGKGGDTEAVTVPSVRVGKEQTKAYIIGRWGGLRDGGFVNEFKYRKDDDYEHEGERGGDLIAVELHCLNWENHCKQSAFIGALTSRNPGMFHDIILHTPDESLYHLRTLLVAGKTRGLLSGVNLVPVSRWTATRLGGVISI